MDNNVFQIHNGLDDYPAVFNVRIVFNGDSFGLNGCLTHKQDEPLIEFYDTTSGKGELGYFVSRYYASTLLNPQRETSMGLMLDTGSPQWRITAESLLKVLAQIKERIEEVQTQHKISPSM